MLSSRNIIGRWGMYRSLFLVRVLLLGALRPRQENGARSKVVGFHFMNIFIL
jgi:hypothetical protein